MNSIQLFNCIDWKAFLIFEEIVMWSRFVESSKLKKLEEYVSVLGKKGAEEESHGDYSSAIPTYLKLVDVLLVMAEEAPGHPYWVRCTISAENYQKKIKSLIAQAALKQERAEAQSH